MTKYRILRADRAAHPVTVGEVYYYGVDGYGIARADSEATGIEHMMLSPDESGTPSFTIPRADVEQFDEIKFQRRDGSFDTMEIPVASQKASEGGSRDA